MVAGSLYYPVPLLRLKGTSFASQIGQYVRVASHFHDPFGLFSRSLGGKTGEVYVRRDGVTGFKPRGQLKSYRLLSGSYSIPREKMSVHTIPIISVRDVEELALTRFPSAR